MGAGWRFTSPPTTSRVRQEAGGGSARRAAVQRHGGWAWWCAYRWHLLPQLAGEPVVKLHWGRQPAPSRLICMPRLHTPTRKQPPPTPSAGLLYTSAPRGELTGTAEFVDAANGLQAVVTFGPIEGARSSALRRPDAFSGSIYLQQARAPLERQASGGVPDSGWVMPTSGDKVRGGRLLLCCAGKVCIQANSSMRSHAMPLAHPCICPTLSPCARPSVAPPASAASAP